MDKTYWRLKSKCYKLLRAVCLSQLHSFILLKFFSYWILLKSLCTLSLFPRVQSLTRPKKADLKVSEMVLGKYCFYRSRGTLFWFVESDGVLINLQMTFVMMTNCKNSPKCPFTEPLQIITVMAAQWINAPQWFVIYTCFSLEMPGTVSVIVFDFLLVFSFCYSPGIESGSSWFQPKLFHGWVEESGFHIFRNAWPEIRNRAEKGCLNGFLFCKNSLIQKTTFHMFYSFVVLCKGVNGK